MLAFNQKYLPFAFGQNNTGNICYFNSLLQGLLSCPQIIQTVLENEKYFGETPLRKEFYAFCKASLEKKQNPLGSTAVLEALLGEIKEKGLKAQLGFTQSSSHEALIYLFDMLGEGPLSGVITNKHRVLHRCLECGKDVSDKIDTNIVLNAFHITQFKNLADQLTLYAEEAKDPANCPFCGKNTKYKEFFALRYLPSVFICHFNLYKERPLIEAPDFLDFAGLEKKLRYVKVAQVEHAGALSGGHYTARVLRQGGGFYSISDNSVSIPSKTCENTPNSYLVFYSFLAGEPDKFAEKTEKKE
jgi:ubiquitin C-terminal hydrolase